MRSYDSNSEANSVPYEVASDDMTSHDGETDDFDKYVWLKKAILISQNKNKPGWLTHKEFRVLVVAFDVSRGDGRNIVLGVPSFAKRAGTSADEARSALHRLVALGYLGPPRPRTGTTTVYHLNRALQS